MFRIPISLLFAILLSAPIFSGSIDGYHHNSDSNQHRIRHFSSEEDNLPENEYDNDGHALPSKLRLRVRHSERDDEPEEPVDSSGRSNGLYNEDEGFSNQHSQFQNGHNLRDSGKRRRYRYRSLDKDTENGDSVSDLNDGKSPAGKRRKTEHFINVKSILGYPNGDEEEDVVEYEADDKLERVMDSAALSESQDRERSDNSAEYEKILALEHSQRVSAETSCEVPKPQVVHVSDHYPGLYFLPHCTLLHRCGKHAGCCGSEHLRCIAQEKEKVFLPFFSVRLGEKGSPSEQKVVKLAFTNHTKCGCEFVF